MKEYELLTKYHYPDTPIESPFDVVSQALYTKQTDMLQLDICKERIIEVLDYIELRRRYDTLFYRAQSKLSYNRDCFELESHKFQTLDEVERALKQKAFL